MDVADVGFVEDRAVRGVLQIDMKGHGSSLSLAGDEPGGGFGPYVARSRSVAIIV
jgi:hypothetical protein